MEAVKGSSLERQAYDYFRARFATVCREYNIPGSGNNWRYDFGVHFGGKDYLVEIDGGYHFLLCGRTEGELINSNQRDSDKTIIALESGFNVVRIHYEDMPEFVSHFDKALASSHPLYLSRKEAYTYLFEYNKERYEEYMTSLLRRYASELNGLFPSPSLDSSLGVSLGPGLEVALGSTLISITEERKAVATRQSNFLKNVVEENQRLKNEVQTAMQSLTAHLEEKKTYLEEIRVLNDEVEGMKAKTARLEEENEAMLVKMQNLKDEVETKTQELKRVALESLSADKRANYLTYLAKASDDTFTRSWFSFWRLDGENLYKMSYDEFDEIVRTNPEATNVDFWKPYLSGSVLTELRVRSDNLLKKEKEAKAAEKAAAKAERIAKAARDAERGAAKRARKAARREEAKLAAAKEADSLESKIGID